MDGMVCERLDDAVKLLRELNDHMEHEHMHDDYTHTSNCMQRFIAAIPRDRLNVLFELTQIILLYLQYEEIAKLKEKI